jgi:hypothetical protein
VTAIAGLIDDLPPSELQYRCLAMLDAMARAGPHGTHFRVHRGAAFGRNLFRVLPEDQHDSQPLVGDNSQALFVADARVDNRDEVAEELGIASTAVRLSDAAVLFAAWERWQLDLADHVLGDYALAAWDTHNASLVLLRSPMGLKPLFYRSDPASTAFASAPAGLLAVSAKAIDLEYAAAVVAESAEDEVAKAVPLEVRPDAVGLDEGGRDAVHGDVVRREFHGVLLHQHQEPAFRRTIGGITPVAERKLRADGQEMDVTPTMARRDLVARNGLRQEHRRLEVGLVYLVEGLLRHFEQGLLTLELDVTALGSSYERPGVAGCAVDVTIKATRRCRRWRAWTR